MASFIDSIRLSLSKAAFSTTERVYFYDRLSKYLDDDISVYDAVRNLYRRHKIRKTVHAARFEYWLKSIESGSRVDQMLYGWIPDTEIVLIKAGADGDLSESLNLCHKLATSVAAIKAQFIGAVIQPMFYLLGAGLLLYGYAGVFFPIQLDLLPVEMWPPEAKSMYTLITFLQSWWWAVVVGLIGVLVIVAWSIPNIGRSKLRSFLDIFPPWSMYRTFSGASTMISLSSMVQSGVSFSDSIKNIRIVSGSEWLRSHLSVISSRLAAGNSAGSAMDTGMVSPELKGVSDGTGIFQRDTCDDLSDFADSASFNRILYSAGDQAVGQTMKSIGRIANYIKYAGLFTVAGLLAWLVAGFMLTIFAFNQAAKSGLI